MFLYQNIYKGQFHTNHPTVMFDLQYFKDQQMIIDYYSNPPATVFQNRAQYMSTLEQGKADDVHKMKIWLESWEKIPLARAEYVVNEVRPALGIEFSPCMLKNGSKHQFLGLGFV